MNKKELLKEGEAWVKDGIITEEQLQAIARRYKKREPHFIFIFFAVLFVSIGVLLYVFSNLEDANFFIRLTIITLFMIILYVCGAYFNQKEARLFAHSFVILGYVFFGATLSLIDLQYMFYPTSDWLFISWAFVGLLVFYYFRSQALLILGMLITIYGQMAHLFETDVSILLILIYAFGYFHFVFHETLKWANWVFPIGLAIHLFIFASSIHDGFYLSFSVALLLLLLALILPKEKLRFAFICVSFIVLYIVNLSESFMLQDNYNAFNISLNWILILLIGLAIVYAILAVMTKQYIYLSFLLLIVPLANMPGAYLLSITLMLLVALGWLIYSYRQVHDLIVPSIMIFIIATLAAYIQIGWDTMNRALFFLIGGILLFVISFILEWQRRKVEKEASQ